MIPTEIERERSRRIRVSLWAYAYEIMNESLVSDEEYDRMCREINPKIKTGKLDDFFEKEFDPSTGMWIHKHPEINKIASLYQRLTGKNAKAVVVYKNETPLVPKNISDVGFKTQTEMKLYLASLGFRVIPHYSVIGNRNCKTEFDKDFATITDTDTGEQRTVFYKELFNESI